MCALDWILLFPSVCAQLLNRVWLLVTPWTVDHQSPLCMGFPRQEYWKESEVAQSCPTLCDPMDTRLLCPWDFLGKSTGVGCLFLLQGTSGPRDWTQYWSRLLFPPTDSANPGYKPESPVSPALAGDSSPLSHLGSPCSPLPPFYMLKA